MSNPSSIAFGCVVAIVSSAIQSLGITLQRKSHLMPIHLDQSHSHYQQKFKRNMWLFGFILFIIANILGSLIQITTLPLIILSPLQSIGLIFNSILSCMLLPGERFTYKLGIGTFIIAGGAFIIAYNGAVKPLPPPDSDDTDYKFSLILMKLTRKGFFNWFITTFVVIGIILFTNYILSIRKDFITKKINKRKYRSHIRYVEKLQFIKGINFGIISGTLTAHTFLFAKSLIDVTIEVLLNDRHNFQAIFSIKNITPYFLLVVMLCIVGCQLTAFNLGLAQILTSILYPLCFLVYNLVNLINDLTFNYLLQDKRMSITQLMLILLGLISVLLGVILISWDSATGSSTPLPITSEDEFIIFLKFPYTDHFELAGDYGSTSQGIYPLSQPKTSHLSFEQKQLLSHFDY